MSKTLITILGLVVSLGVIALGFFLVALPIFVQSLAVDAQTATVASTNEIYEAQVDSLSEQQANLDEISATVDGLHAQIPVTAQLDDVFEVVALAAEQSQVAIQNISAGQQAGFTIRTGASDTAGIVAVPDPTAAVEGTEEPVDGTAVTEEAPAPEAASGRQQVDFSIQVTAADMERATAFIDALRAGPRLLNPVDVVTANTGQGITVQISALTYLDTAG